VHQVSIFDGWRAPQHPAQNVSSHGTAPDTELIQIGH